MNVLILETSSYIVLLKVIYVLLLLPRVGSTSLAGVVLYGAQPFT